MSCGSNPDRQLEKQRNKRARDVLKSQFERAQKEVKILMLGTGESGKSTFIKQMKMSHGDGFSTHEQKQFRSVVFKNCLRSIKALLNASEKLSIPMADSQLEDTAFELLDTPEETFSELRPHYQLFSQIWRDAGIQKCYSQRNKYQLSDSTHYFLSDLERLAQPNYTPTDDDILRAREATTGIHEYEFKVTSKGKPARDDKAAAIFRVLDVGGQRSERRKWIHCFESVKTIIFVAAASEYDQVLVEDEGQNRLQESLALFDTIAQYEYFEHTSFILFLNKFDLLEAKVGKSPISAHFSEFNGNDSNLDDVKDFIEKMYLSCCGQHQLFVHFTTAIDTENIRKLFDDVFFQIVTDHLRDYVGFGP